MSNDQRGSNRYWSVFYEETDKISWIRVTLLRTNVFHRCGDEQNQAIVTMEFDQACTASEGNSIFENLTKMYCNNSENNKTAHNNFKAK